MKPLLSIIIPTKNESKNIVRCLKSCLAQTYRRLEIIVIDNYSTDGTLKAARKFWQLETRNLLVLRSPSVGGKLETYAHGPERSAQRNFGASQSHGDYLLFVDADMELSPHVCQEIMDFFNNSKLETRNSKLIISIPELGQGTNYWERVIALDKNCYSQEFDIHAARAFPKKLFNSVHGYDEQLYAAEDWDLTLRCKAIGAILKTTLSFITHHESAATLQSLLTKDRYYIQNISKFRSKHPTAFSKFSNPFYRLRIYLKNLPLLLRRPFLTLGLIFYKLAIYVSYLISRHASSSNKK